jgi:hypothetical protein
VNGVSDEGQKERGRREVLSGSRLLRNGLRQDGRLERAPGRGARGRAGKGVWCHGLCALRLCLERVF